MHRYILVCAVALIVAPWHTDSRHILPHLFPKKPKAPPCWQQYKAVCPGMDATCLPRTCINRYVNKFPLNRTCTWGANCVNKVMTCDCVGFAYDLPKKICVQRCTPYWWNSASQGERTALAPLIEKTGGYGIIRYNDNKNWLVGKLNVADGTASYITFTNDKEVEIKQGTPEHARVEMLCALPNRARWVRHNVTQRRTLPPDAVMAGLVYRNKRADTENQQLWFPGKIENGVLYQVYTPNNTVLATRQFRVLCIHVASSNRQRMADILRYFMFFNFFLTHLNKISF